jgi:hypothetical protein
LYVANVAVGAVGVTVTTPDTSALGEVIDTPLTLYASTVATEAMFNIPSEPTETSVPNAVTEFKTLIALIICILFFYYFNLKISYHDTYKPQDSLIEFACPM